MLSLYLGLSRRSADIFDPVGILEHSLGLLERLSGSLEERTSTCRNMAMLKTPKMMYVSHRMLVNALGVKTPRAVLKAQFLEVETATPLPRRRSKKISGG